jgi:hypothetical protein
MYQVGLAEEDTFSWGAILRGFAAVPNQLAPVACRRSHFFCLLLVCEASPGDGRGCSCERQNVQPRQLKR